MGQRVLRVCRRAGALLPRDVAGPAPVSCSVFPIDGSSAGAPAPFKARTAGRAAPLGKVPALPAGLCRAAVCASCAFVTTSATKLRAVATCAQRQALA